MIARSIGTAYKKEMLKNIGEIDDEDFEHDGEASGQSSKQMILGSEMSMPFDRHLSSHIPSPVSHTIGENQARRSRKLPYTRNKSGLDKTEMRRSHILDLD